MKTIGTLALLTVFLVPGMGFCQYIDFEYQLPDGTPIYEGLEITDQYATEYGVTFSLIGCEPGHGPIVAEVGDPMIGFNGVTSSGVCSVSAETYSDMPAADMQVGCFFLCDGGSEINCDLRVDYASPVRQASGVLIDVEIWQIWPYLHEEWTIRALRSDDTVIDSVVLSGGDAGTGQGIATPWQFDLAEDIHAIEFIYTGEVEPGSVPGIAFDNFSPASLSSDLAVEKNGPTGPISIGDILAYDLVVTNNGPGIAQNVSLRDFLPAGTSFVSAVSSQGSCSEQDGVVTCDLGILADGESATVDIEVQLVELQLVNTAIVSSGEFDAYPVNNADSVFTYVECSGIPVADDESPHPALGMSKNYPNPFNPQTYISFSVESSRQVRVAVYDLSGRRIASLAEGEFPAGTHTIAWDGTDSSGRSVASGTYLMKMETPGYVKSEKVMLVR